MVAISSPPESHAASVPFCGFAGWTQKGGTTKEERIGSPGYGSEHVEVVRWIQVQEEAWLVLVMRSSWVVFRREGFPRLPGSASAR
ncbi:MAG: hypothetical protein ACE5JA_04175 [bacterium]